MTLPPSKVIISSHDGPDSGLAQNNDADLGLGTTLNMKTASTKAYIAEETFRLMDLPAEIRRMVLMEFVIMPSPIFIGWWGKLDNVEVPGYHFPPIAKKIAVDEGTTEHLKVARLQFEESEIIRQSDLLNIFLASKAIYQECAPFYFHENYFSFYEMPYFEKFVAQIGPAARWQLARIQLVWRGGNAFTRTAKALATCVGLQELTLMISIGSFGYAQPLELRGLQSLLQIRGPKKFDIVYGDQCCFVHIRPHGDEPCQDLIECTTALEERLQVLKLPIDPKTLKKQEAKDFPKKAKRTVLGATNVMTSEKRILAEQQGTFNA